MWNELFLIPFLTGLVLAIVLPLLGCYLRLRDEWLAALAYSHVAAAGALLALVCGMAPMIGGVAAAGLAGAAKRLFARRLDGGASFALLLIGGWAVSVLLAANHPMAERLGHALFDGQLYFAATEQFWLAAGGGLLAVILLRKLSSHLLLAHVYPDFFRIRRLKAWPVQTGFDVLAALCLALATMSMGVMGAFALVFIPPWLAFRRAPRWAAGLRMAVLSGVLAYVAAFLLALGLDQPFGPVLAVLLILVGLVIA
ncbi:ABC transporter [Dechloromonas sp. TW-R-39-2]|uniref:metal ABC transporter permease n=1 Tax=Dechloromonas sp. TW-R-39-2 TaxID=2654218 RepID=UPI00193CEE81|nr:metal ABC transporter permease [Dechloromonas sp. TW-R-39-2]QRM18474.1 ABC transporter [Dechloromonas sp. TW-R-39-2]